MNARERRDDALLSALLAEVSWGELEDAIDALYADWGSTTDAF